VSFDADTRTGGVSACAVREVADREKCICAKHKRRTAHSTMQTRNRNAHTVSCSLS